MRALRKATMLMKSKQVSENSEKPGKKTNKQRSENKEVRRGQSRTGRSSQKDVKNEGLPDYIHEKTGVGDKVSSEKPGFLHENAPIGR